MRQSTQRKSSIHDLGNSGLGAFLASMVGGPDISEGKPIAKGVDAIMAALVDIGKQKSEKGMPQHILDDLKAKLDGVHDAVLYEMPDGSHVFSGVAIDVVGGFEGLDMDTLASAMNFSDRHGGRSAFEDLGGILGARLREAQERMRSPIGEFMRTLKLSEKGDAGAKSKKADSPTSSIMLASSLTAVVLSHYARWRKEPDKAGVAADALAKLIADVQAKDQARFDNLSNYLGPYSVNLGGLVEELRMFAQRPRADAADNLVGQLAKLSPTLVNVMRDAEAKAKEVSDAARAI